MKIITSPRVLSAFWAAWAWLAAAAYWGTTPSQLDPVARLVPGQHIFLVWVATAMVLTVGAVCRHRTIGRWARIVGLIITTWLLIAWATAYIYQGIHEGSRMWVSGKNYAFLALAAMATSPVIGRNTRSQHEKE